MSNITHIRSQAYDSPSQRASGEARLSFVLQLSDRLHHLDDPVAIQYEAARHLGEYLGASRVGYAEIEADGEHSVVTQNYTRGVAGIEGRYRVADYSPALIAALHAGQTVARDDVTDSPDLTDGERAAHSALEIGATVDLPLVRGGRLVAALFMHHREPHAWSADELTLLEDVAARTWDAVERSRAEAALRATNQRLRRALSIETVGVLFFRLDGRIVDANATLERIAGYTAAELRAITDWAQLTPPEFALSTQRAATELAERGRTAPYEKQWIRKDGSRFWGLFAPTRLAGSGRDAECVEFIIDITERVRAEGALRESEAHFRALVRATSDVVYRMSPDWSEMRELKGAGFLADSDAPRRDWLDAYVVHEDQPRVLAAIDAAVRDKRVFELEHRVRRVDGGVGWAMSRAVPVLDARGEIEGWFGAASDVTLRKTAEVERERLLAAAEAARHDAEAASRAKGEFLAVMSHELRTPLNAIGGYAELMELGLRGPVTEQQRADLARIQQSQRHLLGLINQVLNYTRLDAGAVRYDAVPLFVAESLAAAEALVIPQARARRLTYVIEPSAPDLAVLADRDKLQQILLNVLSNAIKFTEPGGEVRVRGEARGAAVAIVVSDTGTGIAPEKLPSVFEPFVQVDQRLTRAHEGVGLGLAISRELARGMGGDLTAESTVGVGSTFTLTLPAHEHASRDAVSHERDGARA